MNDAIVGILITILWILIAIIGVWVQRYAIGIFRDDLVLAEYDGRKAVVATGKYIIQRLVTRQVILVNNGLIGFIVLVSTLLGTRIPLALRIYIIIGLFVNEVILIIFTLWEIRSRRNVIQIKEKESSSING